MTDQLSPDIPTQGPPVATKPYVHDMARFDKLMEDLQKWRSADHEDNIVMCRSWIIEIIEGVKALRAGRTV